MPSRIVHLFQLQLDGLGQVGQGFVDRVTLAGHVNLQALRDKPVLFLVQRCGQGTRRVRHGTRIVTRLTDGPEPGTLIPTLCSRQPPWMPVRSAGWIEKPSLRRRDRAQYTFGHRTVDKAGRRAFSLISVVRSE